MWTELLDRMWSSGATVLLLSVAFYPLERVFSADAKLRPWRKHAIADYAFLFGQYLLFGATAASVLSIVFHKLPLPLLQEGAEVWSGASFVIGVALVAGDVFMYFGHRLQHRVPLLWRFHAVHHSAEELDWVAAHREHPFDGLYTQFLMNLPAVALGVPLTSILGIIAFRGMWAMLIPANVRLPLGPLKWVLGAPEFHRFHHAAVPR